MTLIKYSIIGDGYEDIDPGNFYSTFKNDTIGDMKRRFSAWKITPRYEPNNSLPNNLVIERTNIIKIDVYI